MIESPEAKHLVRHALIVGVQLDDVGYRHLMSEYHADLVARFPDEDLVDEAPNTILDEVIPRLDPVASVRTGGAVFDALEEFCRSSWRLDLGMTASDFGTREKRVGPYRFDRAQYHLGHRLVAGAVASAFPSSCPYRRSRHIPLDWAREHQTQWHELLPDALWWAFNDAPERVEEGLSESAIDELQERLTDAGFATGSLGLYLSTLETVHDADEPLPSR